MIGGLHRNYDEVANLNLNPEYLEKVYQDLNKEIIGKPFFIIYNQPSSVI